MKFLKLPLILCFVIVYASCKKDSDSVDLNPDFYFLDGDTTSSTFSDALVLFAASDTTTFNLIVSSTYLVSKVTQVTIGVDDAARDTYNSIYKTSYQAMPAGAYSFKTTFTDTTNSIYDTIPVTIYKSKLNLANNYMLPINIVSAGGNAILAGSSVIYLHTISNKLLGIYNSTGIKIMYTGDADSNKVTASDTFNIIKSIVPSAYANVSELDYADLGGNGWKYYLSFNFDNSNTFSAAANEVILNSVQTGSFKILNSSYDSTTNNIYIKSSYKNLSGDERIIEESLKLY